MLKCDALTGSCSISEIETQTAHPNNELKTEFTVHYIGDPMCSWCWGISPSVAKLAEFCSENGIGFDMTMGGLRAGGGDSWNPEFRAFLRNEWQHISNVTGQPFGFTLLNAPTFNYDTEPACRAIVSIQLLQQSQNLASSLPLKFLAAVQYKFYVDGQDPKETEFYNEICQKLNINFQEFAQVFNSPTAQQATQQGFIQCRQWGVRAFPTLLVEHDGKRTMLASGAMKSEEMISQLKSMMHS